MLKDLCGIRGEPEYLLYLYSVCSLWRGGWDVCCIVSSLWGVVSSINVWVITIRKAPIDSL